MTTPALAALFESAVRDQELSIAASEERELELTQAEKWARDPLGWIRENVWIASKFQDGEVKRVRPVRMSQVWPDQERTLRAWIDLDVLAKSGELVFSNVLIEKSRQIGETWLLAGAIDWLLSYHRVRGLFMHTRAAEVADRGWSLDSFMGRVKFIHDRNLQAGVAGVGELTFRPFSTDPASITNPRSGAMLRGECQRDDPGRGSSFDFAVVDEAAHVPHGESVHAALDEACPAGKLYLSTPEGSSNMHARLCDEKPQGWEYLRLHWSAHPVYGRGLHRAGELDDCDACVATKAGTGWTANDPRSHRYPGQPTSPWYDRAVVGKTDEQVASELDIDRERSLSGRVYPEFNHGTHVIPKGIPYDPFLPIELAWDYGTDCTSIVVIQDGPEDLRVIGLCEVGDLFGDSGATPEMASSRLLRYLVEIGVPEEQLTPEQTMRWKAIGDPSGGSRDAVHARPYTSHYRKHGFVIEGAPRRMTARIDFAIISVKRLLTGMPKPLRVCGVNGRDFASHMGSNRWKTDAQGIPVQPRAILDDVNNHACKAFGYYVVTKYPPPGQGGEGRTTVARKGRVPRVPGVPA